MPQQAAQAASTVQVPSSAPNAVVIQQAPIPGSSVSRPLAIHVVGVPATTPPEPHWTAYASAIATPLVAIVAAGIAATIQIRQWKTAQAAAQTARNKLKLDLFDKRFAVYEAAAQLIVMMSINTEHTSKEISDRLERLQGIEFLFSDFIQSYVQEQVIHRAFKVVALQSIRAKHAANEDADKVARLNADLSKLGVWFAEQLPVLNDMMRPYLQLSH